MSLKPFLVMIAELLPLMIPLFSLVRCLAHFPPADTYESRGNAADVRKSFEIERAIEPHVSD